MTCRAFVVAGTATGVGKTSVTLGVLRALSESGHEVRPFKVGPDFLDPSLHRVACEAWGRNLDSWMVDREANRRLLRSRASGADVAVVEGVMGLFDGVGGGDGAGSTARMARWLDLPVVLVVDAWRASRSVGAVAEGFARFDPAVDVEGVVVNRVAGGRHAETVRRAIEDEAGLPVFGMVPRDEEAEIPQRHLGLHRPSDTDVESPIARLGELVADRVDLDALVSKLGVGVSTRASDPDPGGSDVRIGVARDRAFSFYYRHNFARLRRAGAELVPFAPTDGDLPGGLDGLYLGGGYPELYAEELASNRRMRRSVCEFAASGRPVLAECGGAMYLADAIDRTSGETYPMCGVFEGTVSMEAPLTMGYAEVTAREGNPLFPAGETARGHEFHRSSWEDSTRDEEAGWRVERPGGGAADQGDEGRVRARTLASYVHLHFGSRPEFAESFVEACRTCGD